MKGKFIALAAAAALLTGCTSKSSNNEQPSENQSNKTLVIYYSQTGTTKAVAEELQSQLGADIATIEAVNPYPDDYDSTIIRWRKELNDSILPEIKPLEVNLDDYSTIFLGFPIWGGTYALPVAKFISEYKLEGKKVVTFATFGSGGIGSATADLAKALPDAEVIKGYGIRTSRISKAKDEIKRFLIENGYIDGQIEKLPDYSTQTPVTAEEVKIFDDACSGYRFPLGTPITVGKRKSLTGTDYKYEVNSKMPDGKEMQATIYVTVNDGEKPEFTLVER